MISMRSISTKFSRLFSSSHPLAPWKDGVVVFKQVTGVNDLKSNYRPTKDGGFYYDHRLIVRRYPDQYTIDELDTRRTGGVDPDTGVRVFPRIGGGIKKKWLWVDLKRHGPASGEPLSERVIKIVKSDCHTAFLALVGHADQIRYVIATNTMKPGDIIKTYGYIPAKEVLAEPNDSWPLGALPIGTVVCCIEAEPKQGAVYACQAGSYCTVVSKSEGRCVLRLPNHLKKHRAPFDISLLEDCMAVIGRCSNENHMNEHLGSANALRHSGYRPRSGLFQKKTGRFGKRRRGPKPVHVVNPLQLDMEDAFKENHEFVPCPKTLSKNRYSWHDFKLEE